MNYSDCKLNDNEKFPGGFAQQLLTAIVDRKNLLISRILKIGIDPVETELLRGQIAELTILEKAFETLYITPLHK